MGNISIAVHTKERRLRYGLHINNPPTLNTHTLPHADYDTVLMPSPICKPMIRGAGLACCFEDLLMIGNMHKTVLSSSSV